MFPVLDWDPKQRLTIPTHHPSIPHALQHKLIISTSGMPVVNYEICYVTDSQTEVTGIVCQRCSISYERHVCICLTQNLSVLMASIGIKETHYIFIFES